MTGLSAANATATFLRYLDEWYEGLESFSLRDQVRDPARAAILSADMVVGFCSQGNLASDRIGGLIAPVRDLFIRAHELGIEHYLLAQDTHHEATPEFQAFLPHCVQGSAEAQTVPQLKELPFSHRFTVIEKNSLHPAIGTLFDRWLEEHADLLDAIVVGDCTDLCTYHLAMYLRLRANALDIADLRVVVPVSAVETYDLQVETARELGVLAHPGDFFHRVFLYHMALNGIQVVKEIV